MVSIVVSLALPDLAHAQPQFAPQTPTVYSTSALPDQKSPATALQLSVLSTAAGFGMMAAGSRWDNGAFALTGFAITLVGPNLGHFYAGETGRGLGQIGLRVGAVGAMIAGAFWGFAECFALFGEERCETPPIGPSALIIGGVVLGTGSTLYSLYDAPRAARRHNARMQRLMLTPAPMAGPDHSSGVGLHLSGRF
jgi:hypothetical protein